MQIENRTPATAPLTSQAENQTDIVAKLEALAEIGPVVEIGRKHLWFTSVGWISVKKRGDDCLDVDFRSSEDYHDPRLGPALGASFSRATGKVIGTRKKDVVIYDVADGPEADEISRKIRADVDRAYAYNFK